MTARGLPARVALGVPGLLLAVSGGNETGAVGGATWVRQPVEGAPWLSDVTFNDTTPADEPD